MRRTLVYCSPNLTRTQHTLSACELSPSASRRFVSHLCSSSSSALSFTPAFSVPFTYSQSNMRRLSNPTFSLSADISSLLSSIPSSSFSTKAKPSPTSADHPDHPENQLHPPPATTRLHRTRPLSDRLQTTIHPITVRPRRLLAPAGQRAHPLADCAVTCSSHARLVRGG